VNEGRPAYPAKLWDSGRRAREVMPAAIRAELSITTLAKALDMVKVLQPRTEAASKDSGVIALVDRKSGNQLPVVSRCLGSLIGRAFGMAGTSMCRGFQ
jgi:hypothetical protein